MEKLRLAELNSTNNSKKKQKTVSDLNANHQNYPLLNFQVELQSIIASRMRQIVSMLILEKSTNPSLIARNSVVLLTAELDDAGDSLRKSNPRHLG